MDHGGSRKVCGYEKEDDNNPRPNTSTNCVMHTMWELKLFLAKKLRRPITLIMKS